MNEERITEAFSNEEVAEEMKRKDEVLKRIEQGSCYLCVDQRLLG